MKVSGWRAQISTNTGGPQILSMAATPPGGIAGSGRTTALRRQTHRPYPVETLEYVPNHLDVQYGPGDFVGHNQV
jgi:hypothetical protein